MASACRLLILFALAGIAVAQTVTADFGNRLSKAFPIPSGIVGTQFSNILPTTVTNTLYSAGFRKMRMHGWLQSVYATTTPNWTKLDSYLDAVKASGVKVTLELTYTPPWLLPPLPVTQTSTTVCPQSGQEYKVPPTDVNTWANLATSIVTHVNQEYPGLVTDVEIWNEPELGSFCTNPSDSTTRLNRYLSIYATTAPKIRALGITNTDGTPLRIGGPTIVSTGAISQWIGGLVTDSGTAPYVDFVSYHKYPSGNSDIINGMLWDQVSAAGTTPLYNRVQSTGLTGFAANYIAVAKAVKAGKQPNPSQTRIYLDEYNDNWQFSDDCCRNNRTYSPLFNGLVMLDMLSSVYQGAHRVPDSLFYYSANNPPFCLIGDEFSHCGARDYSTKYAQFYLYSLFASPSYLGLASGGSYMALSVSPLPSTSGLAATAFFTPGADNIVIVNPTTTNFANVQVAANNPGFSVAQATKMTLNSSNPTIATQTISVTSTGTGYSTSVAVPPYTVLAISLAQQSGPPPVAVSISPTTASIAPSATQQFQATVTGTTNTAVTWSVDGVNGGNTTVGTVSSNGLYTAPSTAGNHTVKVTSNADTTKSASAAVTVTTTQTVAVSISPTTASVAQSATQQFQATVTGTTNTAVTWSVDGVNGGNTTVGTVSTTGLYTAPTTAGNHTVKATSNADPTKSASAAVTVTTTQTVAVSISPTTASLAPSATKQFQATVTGTTNTAVTWSVDNVNGGNSTVGTVSSTGLYTAPTTTGNHTVKATSNADTTKSASAAVTVATGGGVTIAISPTSTSVPTGTTRQFAATVTGTTNTGVKWYVDGVLGGTTSSGTITTSGLYTAPSTTGNHVVKIISNADATESASSQVTVTTVTIAISPTSVTLPLNGTKQFAATVTGTTNTGVKWYVDGVLGGTTTSGLITTAGKYTAPNAAGSHTVKITSNADPTKSALSAVTVN